MSHTTSGKMPAKCSSSRFSTTERVPIESKEALASTLVASKDSERYGIAQEIHQVIVHLLCAAVDREVLASPVIPSAEELPDEESAG